MKYITKLYEKNRDFSTIWNWVNFIRSLQISSVTTQDWNIVQTVSNIHDSEIWYSWYSLHLSSAKKKKKRKEKKKKKEKRKRKKKKENITTTLFCMLYTSHWTSSKSNIFYSSNLHKFQNQMFLPKCFSSCEINKSSIDLWGHEPKLQLSTLWTIRLTYKKKNIAQPCVYDEWKSGFFL